MDGKKIALYGTFFLNIVEVLRDSKKGLVLIMLANKAAYNHRKNKTEVFDISSRELSKITQISRVKIKSIMEELGKQHFLDAMEITDSGFHCSVNIDFINSLMFVYDNSEQTGRDIISLAVSEGDKNKLSELGIKFKLDDMDEENIEKQCDSFIVRDFIEDTCQGGKKSNEVVRNETSSGKILTEVVRNEGVDYDILTKVVRNDTIGGKKRDGVVRNEVPSGKKSNEVVRNEEVGGKKCDVVVRNEASEGLISYHPESEIAKKSLDFVDSIVDTYNSLLNDEEISEILQNVIEIRFVRVVRNEQWGGKKCNGVVRNEDLGGKKWSLGGKKWSLGGKKWSLNPSFLTTERIIEPSIEQDRKNENGQTAKTSQSDNGKDEANGNDKLPGNNNNFFKDDNNNIFKDNDKDKNIFLKDNDNIGEGKDKLSDENKKESESHHRHIQSTVEIKPLAKNINGYNLGLDEEEEEDDEQFPAQSKNNSADSDEGNGEEHKLSEQELRDSVGLPQVFPGMKPKTLSWSEERLQTSYPLFQREEVERMLYEYEYCLDDAYKMLVNRVWDVTTELVTEDEDEEEGKEVNPEYRLVPEDMFERDVVKAAWDEVMEAIEAGETEVKGVTLPVTAKPITFNQALLCVNWEKKDLYTGCYYTPDKSLFRNVGAGVIKNTLRGNYTRQELRLLREENIEYEKKLNDLGNDDKTFDQLTPIEKAAYFVFVELFDYDDKEKMPTYPKKKYFNKLDMDIIMVKMHENYKITREDFNSVLWFCKLDPSDGISFVTYPFSARKMEQWNKLHSFQSVIEFEHKDIKTEANPDGKAGREEVVEPENEEEEE